MTTNDAFDRRLSSWLHDEAEHPMPDHLDEVLVRTAATRQRAWWSSPERWLPLDLTTSRSAMTGRGSQLRPLVVLFVIALLAMAIVALAAGARRSPLEPFGIARNGIWASSSDGDIHTLDPATGERTVLIAGDGFDFSPAFSRDGSRLMFLRSDGPLTDPAYLTLMVANADGTDLRAATPPVENLSWVDWSPDGTRIAYMAGGDLWVVDVDERVPTVLATDFDVHFPQWLPPDGQEIIVRREGIAPAIFAVRADGTGLRQLTHRVANNRFDYQSIAVAPDGSQVTFTRWFDAVPRVFALDIQTGTERAFPTADGAGQLGAAVFSPDASLVAYARIRREGTFQVVVAAADGSGEERALGPQMPSTPDGSSVDATWAFTPDGTGLIVRYGSDDGATMRLLPLDGSADRVLDAGAFEFIDVQRLAP
jgi:Tol biopolymer transport system component